jgi:centromeric protein E
MKDVFRFNKSEVGKGRVYLLRYSYSEIDNETMFDLLASPSVERGIQVGIQGVGTILSSLRDVVTTSLKGVKDVLRRGEGHRRIAYTDGNKRSPGVFRPIHESR